MRKRLTALAAVGAALLVPATPALAQSGGPISPEVVALMATQDQLHEIAGRIDRTGGFGGFHVDAGSRTLDVYWKGRAPAAVGAAAAVAEQRGLTVKVHSAEYSRAELDAEAARLVATGAVQSVAAKHDGSGLAVTPKAGLSARSALRSSVAVETRSGGFELVASRLADTPPFKGGAYIANYRNGVPQGGCSSGFAMTSNSTGAPKLLTAAHCGQLGSGYSNNSDDPIGWVESRSVESDSETIVVPDAQPRVWIGDSVQTELDTGSANQYGLDVVGAASTLPGDWLCDSGAYSGTICDIQATATGVTVCFPDFGCAVGLVDATHRGGFSAGGNGDSGGPVFSVQPGDKLVARGTLTAISLNSADVRQCSGVPAGNGRQCSQRIVFPDITNQMAAHDVRVMTVS
ncbi:hypothetical protein [Lentzea sp. NPDC060358]|uniref:hypothetical protein n=1 Tax=Lentzea sp. NPDC060358 TaxID=3347103 RepID=UPI00364690A8